MYFDARQFWPINPLQGGLQLNEQSAFASGLVGLFHSFDGGMRDISPYQHPVTLVNAGGDITPDVGAFGKTNLFVAGATADRFNLGSITSDNPLSFFGATEFSAVVWMNYQNAAGSNFPRVIDKSSGGSAANGWYIDVDETIGAGNALELNVNGSNRPSGAGLVLDNQVACYAVTANNASTRYYRNGVFFSSGSHTYTFPSTTTNAAIGQWNHSTLDRRFSGHIYTIALWNRRLLESEIAALYYPEKRWDLFRQPANEIWITDVPATSGITGTSAVTEGADTSSASGSVAGAISGSSAVTEGADTSAASGAVTGAGASFGVADFEGNGLDESSSSITNPTSATPTIDLVQYLSNGTNFWAVSGAVRGVNGKTPNFTIDFTNQWGSGLGDGGLMWTTTPYDIDSWQFFDNNTGTTIRTYSNNAAFTADTIYVSTVRFMTHNVISNWLDSLADSPYLHKPQSVKDYNGTSQWAYAAIASDTLEGGQTIPAQEQLACRVTDVTRQPTDGNGKRKVILCSGVHASEDIGTEALLRSIEFLLSASPTGDAKALEAYDLVRDFDFYIYPTINPGRYRHQTYGYDDNVSGAYNPNGNWNTARPFARAWHEAVAVAIDTDLPNGTAHALLDYHAQTNDTFSLEFWNNVSDADLTNFEAAADDYEASSGINIFNNAGAIRTYAETNWSTPHAYAVELPYNKALTQSEVTAVGEAVMRAMHDRYAAGDFSQTPVATKISFTVTNGANLSGLSGKIFYHDDTASKEPPFMPFTNESTDGSGTMEVIVTGYLEIGEKAEIKFDNYAGDTDPATYNYTGGIVTAVAV